MYLDAFFIVNILLALSVIFLERKNTASTWAWIMIMLFIPILGFILYLFLGQNMHKRNTFSKKEEEDYFFHLLHGQSNRLRDHLNEFKDITCEPYLSVLRLHLIGHDSLFSKDNVVKLYTDGTSKFADLFDSIKAAKEYIHMEYYIIRDDFLSHKLCDLLIEKADEGVKIRLLYDGMGCLRTPKSLFKELQAHGILVCAFFPPFIPYINLRINYRNHRKICVVDGEVAYMGGFNIGSEYIGLDKKLGYWRDTHLQLVGSSVQMLDLQFLLDWRFAYPNETIDLDHYIRYRTPNLVGNTGIQIVASGPDSKHSSIRNGYIRMISCAKSSICIQTPYFIPDEGVLSAIKIAALSGIDVKIMIPNKPDHLFVHWASYSYLGEVLACGAKCYTYEKGFLHAKTIVIDDEICSVGTANFDIRSFTLNFEVNAFIYDANIASRLGEIFHQDLMDCLEVTLEDYETRSYQIKFKESISRLVGPIL